MKDQINLIEEEFMKEIDKEISQEEKWGKENLKKLAELKESIKRQKKC